MRRVFDRFFSMTFLTQENKATRSVAMYTFIKRVEKPAAQVASGARRREVGSSELNKLAATKAPRRNLVGVEGFPRHWHC